MVISSKSVNSHGVKVKIEVQYANKEPFYIISVVPMDTVHEEATIVKYVLDGFYAKCMPDETPTPNILGWEFGDWKLVK